MSSGKCAVVFAKRCLNRNRSLLCSFANCSGFDRFELDADARDAGRISERLKRFIAEDDFISDYFEENSSLYWNARAQMTLRSQLMKRRTEKVAKNVIFFLGDGMSIATLTASRIYAGQREGRTGEESKLSFEEFPYIGLSKVRRSCLSLSAAARNTRTMSSSLHNSESRIRYEA